MLLLKHKGHCKETTTFIRASSVTETNWSAYDDERMFFFEITYQRKYA